MNVNEVKRLLAARGYKPAPTTYPGTLFFQDDRGSATIHLGLGSLEIWQPLDAAPALLSPGYSPEVVRQVIEKTKTHFAGNPEYNSQEKACMRDALEMFYARLLRLPSTPPDTERGG